MSKLNQPAKPCQVVDNRGPVAGHVRDQYTGLTKREYACIHLSVPNSGDEDLDVLIKIKLERDIVLERIAGAPDSIRKQILDSLSDTPYNGK